MIPMFKLDVGNALGISYKWYGYGLKGQRSTLGLGLTAIRRGFELYGCLLVRVLYDKRQSHCHEGSCIEIENVISEHHYSLVPRTRSQKLDIFHAFLVDSTGEPGENVIGLLQLAAR